MREPGELVSAFPRPGRALKAVLATIAVVAVVGAIVVNWAPGGTAGKSIFFALAFDVDNPLGKPWALVTSGVLTSPVGISHALWSLLGLYFLTPDLERRWGGARLVRFLIATVVVSNLVVLAGNQLRIENEIFHPGVVFGPLATITATAIAWSKENAQREIRFMFFLPMTGRTLFWITVGFGVLALVFAQGAYEGALSPMGGVAAGLLFGGSPSPMRTLWLRLKLFVLRRRGATLTVESITGERPRAGRRRAGPALRVVPGGLEDELKNRKPPKDKRYLN